MGIVACFTHLNSRTLPRVRELKLELRAAVVQSCRRTLPRVRELKQRLEVGALEVDAVAPFPGCVN